MHLRCSSCDRHILQSSVSCAFRELGSVFGRIGLPHFVLVHTITPRQLLASTFRPLWIVIPVERKTYFVSFHLRGSFPRMYFRICRPSGQFNESISAVISKEFMSKSSANSTDNIYYLPSNLIAGLTAPASFSMTLTSGSNFN